MNTPPLRSETILFGKPSFSDEEVAAVTRVIRSGWVGMGPETIAFENELAHYLGVPHVVSVNSCTSALFLALLVAGVQEGDEVICPSLTWCATANAALYLRAKVVFCDVDPDTLCLTPETVLPHITPRTRALMAVHFGGRAVDVKALKARLPAQVQVVEDAAHAFGSRFSDGRRVGTSGSLTCFSFYANKNLSTGEGGTLATPDDALAARLRSLRQNALPNDAWKRYLQPQATYLSFELKELGYKMNYTDLQACLGRVQLQRFEALQTHRQNLVRHYRRRLAGLGPRIAWQSDVESDDHARHLLCIQLMDGCPLSRNELYLALRERKIGASIHYAPLHQMPLYQHPAESVLPNTDDVVRRILTLPISASLSVDEVDYVCDHVLLLLGKAMRGGG